MKAIVYKVLTPIVCHSKLSKINCLDTAPPRQSHVQHLKERVNLLLNNEFMKIIYKQKIKVI